MVEHSCYDYATQNYHSLPGIFATDMGNINVIRCSPSPFSLLKATNNDDTFVLPSLMETMLGNANHHV